MANTISVLLRTMVSKKRRRYTEGGFDLDLAYIRPNIIAMGYPGENVQGIFRNHINDVCGFFEATHKEHYKVYNLRSDMSYDANKFHGRVSVYAFEDHNPPTIELIQKFCYDVDCWLKADTQNVAAIHCKAGKGRTGTMICCYLLYSGLETTAEKSLAYYGEKRTINQKGVTIPSQRRYVQYYARLIQSNITYERIRLQLCEIRFSPATTLLREGTMQCLISTMEQIDHRTQHPDSKSSKVSYIDSARPSWTKVTVKELDKFPIDFRKTRTLELYEQNVFVTGDVKIELKKWFHFWFNTFFVCDNAVYEGEGENIKIICTLPKCELDDAHKDKDHKLFPEDFEVQLVLKPCNSHTRINDSNEIPQLRPHNNHNNHVNSLTHSSHNNANMLLTQKPIHASAIPTSSKTGVYSLYQNYDRSRKPTSMPPFSPPNAGGVAGGSSHTSLNHMQNLMQRHHQQQHQQQQQKRSSEPTPSVNPESINRSNNKNHNSNHHHQSQQQQQHTHQHTTHHHNHHQNPLHEQKAKPLQQQQFQNQPQLQSQQNNKSSTSSNNIHNTSSNSNSSSSSSISSQSSSSASSAGVGGGGGNDGGVGEEEDWESGESSTTTTTTSTFTTTTSPTTTSYFPYKRLNSSQNDDDDDNSNKNVIHDDDDDDKGDEVSVIHTETTKSSTVAVASTITTTTSQATTITATIKSNSEPITSPMATAELDLSKGCGTTTLLSSPPSSTAQDEHKEAIPNTRLSFAIPLSTPTPTPTPTPTASSNGVHQSHPPPYITQASNKNRHMQFFHKKCSEERSIECNNKKSSIPTKCTTASRKFLKLIKSERFKAKTIASGMGSSLALNSGVGASSSAATQNQLLKKKKKVKSKGKIPPSKTFQWLHSYFRTDPDFHENLSQQTTIPMGRRNSAGSISSRNHLNSIGSTSGRACSVEKSLLVGSLGSRGATSMDFLKSDDEDDEEYHILGLRKPAPSSGAVKKDAVLMQFHIKIPTKKSNFETCHSVGDTISPFRSGFSSFHKCKSDMGLCFGTSPLDRALGNIVDVGIQLNPESEKCKYTSMSQLNAASLLTKSNLRPATLDTSNCDEKSPNVATDLPRVSLGKSSPPSNERTTSIGSSNISNSMDHLCVPFSNIYLQPQSSLDDGSCAEVYQDHDDYYSSICDTQLSFNNSPCKSPRSLSEVIDLKPAITQRIILRQADYPSPSAKAIARAASAAAIVHSRKNTASSDGIVIAKPVESHSIGFNVELTSATNSGTPPTTDKYNTNVVDSEEPKSPIDSTLKLITNPGAMSVLSIIDNHRCGGGDVGVDDTDCGTLNPDTPKADGSSSSSSGYCCTSEGSQSVSSTSIGITDTRSSSGTAFSLDGGSSGVMVIDSKKKFSLPTPEIEVCEIGMTKNRSSSVSNNDNINNISKLFASSSLSSSSSSGSSVDNDDKH